MLPPTVASRLFRLLLALGVLVGSPARAEDKASSGPPQGRPPQTMSMSNGPPQGRPPQTMRTHVVYAGQRLGSIAKRYNVSVEALCGANDIRRTDPIRPGQRLIIPDRDDRDGAGARAQAAPRADRSQATAAVKPTPPGPAAKPSDTRRAVARRADESYAAYAKPPLRKGRIEAWRAQRRFQGYVFDRRGRLLPKARNELSRLLGATGDRPKLHPRLFELLVTISDKFGGRALRLVGGYRPNSYFEDSRHKSSAAIDLSIPGVPNRALVGFLRTLPRVGVGYYPNSSFVHLDVRDFAAYWVDYSGPGEAPRRHPSLPAREQPAPEAERTAAGDPLETH